MLPGTPAAAVRSGSHMLNMRHSCQNQICNLDCTALHCAIETFGLIETAAKAAAAAATALVRLTAACRHAAGRAR